MWHVLNVMKNRNCTKNLKSNEQVTFSAGYFSPTKRSGLIWVNMCAKVIRMPFWNISFCILINYSVHFHDKFMQKRYKLVPKHLPWLSKFSIRNPQIKPLPIQLDEREHLSFITSYTAEIWTQLGVPTGYTYTNLVLMGNRS